VNLLLAPWPTAPRTFLLRTFFPTAKDLLRAPPSTRTMNKVENHCLISLSLSMLHSEAVQTKEHAR
jgi:hypothetical protein